MKTLSLGYSPCPNDTFIFYALIHDKIDRKNLVFKEQLLDVERLNQKALQSELDLTKISYHAFGHVQKKYCLLTSGSALGRGCGPLIIARNRETMEALKDKKIAIPGKLTTAYMLLQLYDSKLGFRRKDSDLHVIPYHKIVDAVNNGVVDAGLIIHESRFTFSSHGLKEIMDLGAWWERETGYPLPLGGIIAKRSLGHGLNKKINKLIKTSIEYALNKRTDPMEYIKETSQELSDDVINQHINLYVNDLTLNLGQEGEKAVHELLTRAEHSGIIPQIRQPLFL